MFPGARPARFLAVGVNTGMLSPWAANEVLRLQAVYRRGGVLNCPRVGEIAVHRGFLRSAELELLLARLDDLRKTGARLRDPVRRWWRHYYAPIGVKGGVVVAGVALISMLATWFLTGSWAAVEAAGAIAGFVSTMIQMASPAVFHGMVFWHRIVRVLLLSTFLVAVIAAVQGIVSLRESVDEPMRRKIDVIVVSLVVASGLALASAIVSAFRHREMWTHEARLGLLEELESCRFGQVAMPAASEDIDAAAERTLARGLQLLSVNLWTRCVRRLVP